MNNNKKIIIADEFECLDESAWMCQRVCISCIKTLDRKFFFMIVHLLKPNAEKNYISTLTTTAAVVLYKTNASEYRKDKIERHMVVKHWLSSAALGNHPTQSDLKKFGFVISGMSSESCICTKGKSHCTERKILEEIIYLNVRYVLLRPTVGLLKGDDHVQIVECMYCRRCRLYFDRALGRTLYVPRKHRMSLAPT